MASEVDHFQRILDLEQELREVRARLLSRSRAIDPSVLQLEDEREKEVSSLYGGSSVNHFSSFVQVRKETNAGRLRVQAGARGHGVR